MIVTPWYHVDEKLPESDGSYLCMVGPTTRYASQREIKFCHFILKTGKWMTHWDEGEQKVVFWMVGSPFKWYDTIIQAKPTECKTEAEHDAYKNLVDALERYNMILTLVGKK